jgi:hypothetical protein
MGPSLLETGLLQNAVVRTRGEIIAWFARHSDTPDLDRMLELAVTSALCGHIPTVGLQHTKHFADFHLSSIASGALRFWLQGDGRSYPSHLRAARHRIVAGHKAVRRRRAIFYSSMSDGAAPRSGSATQHLRASALTATSR